MGKTKKALHGINIVAMFLLALATWRFHSVINSLIDRGLTMFGIVDPLITDFIALSALLLIIVTLFWAAGVSIKTIFNEMMGR